MPSNKTTNLDLFLLGLIREGLTSAYEFRERAAVSVGASLPALRRLQEMGYISRGKRLNRNRRELKLTALGQKQLRTGIRTYLKLYQQTPPSDGESILRVFSLAMCAGKHSAARRLLSAASAAKKQAAWDSKSSVENLRDLGSTYIRALNLLERERRSGERKAFARLSLERDSIRDEKSRRGRRAGKGPRQRNN
jgi:DNA-binding PadR family transcriptional regulator